MSCSVIPFSETKSVLGESYQAKYILRYLDELGCKTALIEPDYIDKDFLIDYSNFYCRSFRKTERLVKRIHFFSKVFNQAEYERALETKQVDECSGKYLGFALIKPIQNILDQNIIGRTVLNTYPEYDSGKGIDRHFLAIKCQANLYGKQYCLASLPFQSQDTMVGACATIGLWTASQAINSIWGIEVKSPSEITKEATTYPTQDRRFPSSGLHLEQMIHYLHSLGLETDYVTVSSRINITNHEGNPDTTFSGTPDGMKTCDLAMVAFQNMKIPIIATMAIKLKGQWAYHVSVVSGYRTNSHTIIDEFYLHDDQIGPYCRTKWVDRNIIIKKEEKIVTGVVKQIENHWTIDKEPEVASELAIMNLIIPLYHKIRTPFSSLIPVYDKYVYENRDSADSNVKILLYQNKKYKNELYEMDFPNKICMLTEPLPKYLYIIRISHKTKVISDVVYDATEPQVRNGMRTIDFV